MNADPNDIVRKLVEAWCARKEYGPLATVLPAWLANNGLTDGWEDLHKALKSAYCDYTDLPPQERIALKEAYIAIDFAIMNR